MRRAIPMLALLLAAAGPTPIQPGKWQTTITIVDATIPGAPLGVLAAMRGRPTVVTSCVTATDAARGPRAALERTGGRCRYTEFSMTGGAVRSTMVCVGGREQSVMTHATGSFTPTSITMDAVGSGAGGMTMKSHMASRRIGGF